MNNEIKASISNVKISTDGENYKPIEVKATIISFEQPEGLKNTYDFDFTKPYEYVGIIRKKKYGTMFERCLYFKNHKKKRIRKKYNMFKMLGGK